MSEHILQITTDLYSFVSDSEILLRERVTPISACANAPEPPMDG